MVTNEIQREARFILPLEDCASIRCITLVIEQEELDESRGSRPVLWEHRGETPLCDPTTCYFMRHLKLTMLIAVLMIKIFCYAQVDSLQNNRPNSHYKYFREKSSSFLVGLHLQETKYKPGNGYKRKYFEVGLHKTILTNYAVFTHGLSVEVSSEKRTIVGLKYGGWTNYTFFSLGLNCVYYTDFTHGSFIIRPEFGLGIDRFRFAFGFNVSTFSNEGFNEIKEPKGQIMLNVLLRRKLIKRD